MVSDCQQKALANPQSIRVWQGFRSVSLAENRPRFCAQLGEIFIPATVQQMTPLGLQAYFPLILPESGFSLPDELALVVYPDLDTYFSASRKSVAGRAYGALHSTVFNFSSGGEIPRSRSDFPQLWQGELPGNDPVYIFDREVDWHQGNLRCLVVQGDISATVVAAVVNDWQKQVSPDNSNAILQLEPGYLLCWEYSCGEEASLSDQLTDALTASVITDTRSVRVIAEPLFSIPDQGVEPETGVLMDVRLKD